jgi:hypothetical protein
MATFFAVRLQAYQHKPVKIEGQGKKNGLAAAASNVTTPWRREALFRLEGKRHQPGLPRQAAGCLRR